MDVQLSCRSCHMTCRSVTCFKEHLVPQGKRKESSCDRWWKCVGCMKVLDRKVRDPKDHVCEERWCKSCKKYVFNDHMCYMRAIENKRSLPRFIFFDFECTQSDRILQCPDGYLHDADKCKSCDATDPCSLCTNCQKSHCGKYEHVPNLVIAHKVCEMCVDENFTQDSKCMHCGSRCPRCNHFDKESQCYSKEPCQESCGFREVVFRGADVKNEFGRWLFSPPNKDYTALAHNMKGYDGYFLLEYLVTNSIVPHIIYSGSKLMYIHVAKQLNIKILDSYNFLPTKLSQLPKAFDLRELKKGYFPHFFNTPENQNYVGPYPDVAHYGCDTMSDTDRSAFLNWHRAQIEKGAVFDFSREIVEYCRSDVDILRQACLKFREILMQITGKESLSLNDEGNLEYYLQDSVDPFNYITIASVCMAVFKSKFLPEEFRVKMRHNQESLGYREARRRDGQLYVNIPGEGWVNSTILQMHDYVIEEEEYIGSSIAQVPSAGYHCDQFSKMSITWLEWVVEKQRREGIIPIYIQHALNEGEQRLPNSKYKLDGYCRETNTAYEFHGCLWHGCPTCYSQSEKRRIRVPRTNQTLDELYALTRKKERFIKSLGMTLVTMWEHEFEQLLLENREVSDFAASLDIQDRLNPREAFFGGRTNAAKLYHKVGEGEKIHYLDFCSLYPSVNKYCKYPCKHPRIITKNFDSIEKYFGIAKIEVLPPEICTFPSCLRK